MKIVIIPLLAQGTDAGEIRRYSKKLKLKDDNDQSILARAIKIG